MARLAVETIPSLARAPPRGATMSEDICALLRDDPSRRCASICRGVGGTVVEDRRGDDTMEPRIDYQKFNSEPLQALLAMEKYISGCGLEDKFIHLLKLRASQINGCAYCIDMHFIDARAAGETEQRLYALDAWRETPFYDDRERAALAWIEAVTLVSQTHVPDSVYEEAKKHFSEKEIVDLTYLAATINAWNRLAVSLRAVPGHYKARTTTA
jgi:AhpD family alkylhydroperoxidase